MKFPLRSVFVAFPLENEAKWQFQALQEELRPFEDCLRFQNPQSPHLTVQFWKEMMEIEWEPMRRQCQKIAEKTESFTFRVTEADTFSHNGQDSVLYLSVAFSEELARLKKSCPWVSAQKFHPHITLARMRHPQKFMNQKKKIMKALSGCSFEVPVDRLRLYAEVGGAKQTMIEDFIFNA